MLFYSLGFILESVIPGTDIQRFHSLLYTKNMERDIGDEAVMVSRYMCDDIAAQMMWLRVRISCEEEQPKRHQRNCHACRDADVVAHAAFRQTMKMTMVRAIMILRSMMTMMT